MLYFMELSYGFRLIVSLLYSYTDDPVASKLIFIWQFLAAINIKISKGKISFLPIGVQWIACKNQLQGDILTPAFYI